MTRARAGAATLAAGLVCLAARAEPPDLSPYTADAETVERLEAGEIVAREGMRFSGIFDAAPIEDGEYDLVMFLVDVPERAVWSVLTGFEQQPEFMPHMADATATPRADAPGTNVCFEYEILWIDSRNCFVVERRREAGALVGTLDAGNSDDRLNGVNYFWHVRSWDDGRLLLAYYQAMSYSGALAGFGHEMFVGAERTAEAVRERVRRVAEEGSEG